MRVPAATGIEKTCTTARWLVRRHCDTGVMAFKTGFIVGAAAGYVLGARAGRERYEQIVAAVKGFMGNDRVQSVTGKGKSYIDQATDKVRGTVGGAITDVSDRIRGDGMADAS